VKNLSVQKLRKIILEEMQSMLNDDVLFSLDQLPASGTGRVSYDNDDMSYPYDEEEESGEIGSCISCGGQHDQKTPCGEHPADDDIDSVVNHIMDLLS
jgi:hypothetical protein